MVLDLAELNRYKHPSVFVLPEDPYKKLFCSPMDKKAFLSAPSFAGDGFDTNSFGGLYFFLRAFTVLRFGAVFVGF